jgi:hypothetical protein
MAWFWWLLGVLILVLWIAAIVDIIRKRHSRSVGKTVAWILLIIILPILGTIIYFLVNGAGGPVAPRSAEMDRMTGERY